MKFIPSTLDDFLCTLIGFIAGVVIGLYLLLNYA